MILNDLLQSLGRPKMCLTEIQWSLTNPRSPKYVSYLDSMIVNDLLQSLGRSNLCLFLDFMIGQWSLTKPRLPKYVSYLDSMIVNDLLQILGCPTNVFIWSLWSSMISYKASVAQICFFLFVVYDRQWSLTKPRSPKYVSYLDSMIINDLLQILGRPNMCLL